MELGVSPRRVRALIRSRRLPAFRIGRRNWALDRNLLPAQRRARGGRPVSAVNAWALLALLSGSDAPGLDPVSRSRLKRRMLSTERLETALRFSELRAAVHRWRILPGDLPKLRDFGLVQTGLSAPVRGLDIVSSADELDGYVSAQALAQIEKRLRPLKSADNPNVTLRVPSQPWILTRGRVAPPAVVAADLLAHPDRRVARAGRKLLQEIADR
jgi:hypothetical protein